MPGTSQAPRREPAARATALASLHSFGEFLKYLRRRARMTQDELGRAVGYSREQITRLERNQRLPDPATLAALFVPALNLRSDPELVARFLELAAQARGEHPPSHVTITHIREQVRDGDAQAIHRAAAEWAELAQGDVLQAAREYGLAGDFKRAADTLTDQGAILFNQGKAEETAAAIDELAAALRARADDADADDLRRLLTTRGDVLLNTARADQAEANYREALALAKGAVRATLVYRIGVALTQRGRAAEALTLTQDTLAHLEPHHQLLRAQLRIVEAGAHMALAQYEDATGADMDALALADQFALAMPLMAAGVRARAHNTLGAINAIRGQRAAALAHWQDTVATAQLAGFRQLEYRAQGNIANLYYEQGALGAAEKACDAALAGLKSISDLQAAAKFIHLRSNLHSVRGEISESLALAQEACALKQQLGDRKSYFASRHQETRMLVMLGRLAEARAISEASLAELARLGDQRTRGYWSSTLSEIEMLEGHAGRARQILEAALNLPGASQDTKLQSDCANHLAVAALMLGDTAQAERWLTQQQDLGSETLLERDLILGLIRWARGERVQATDALQNVAARAKDTGYFLFQKRAENILLGMGEDFEAGKVARWIYGTAATLADFGS